MSYPITFGKYLLLERVNVGGMAEVFKAKAFGVEGFERILAIKRILPNMADDDEFINMFVDEARIAVQLSHANIVQIYELGKYENQYYIAMEYVSGKDMRQILDYFRKKQEMIPLPAAAFLVSKLCEGLDYAHRKTDPTGRPLNLIHRDVSPQNILVSYEGAVKITDFGIAKAEDRASKTQAGVLKGKFGYMSPEQVRGLEIDHRSDIFAVGILMYEMVTGKRLFIGESDFSTLEKVRNAEVVPPAQYNPDVSAELEAIIMKALARERDERYQWASELHDDLQQFLIEDNTIYNAKRLAALLQQEYGEDMQLEMQRMEELMHVPAPSNPEALQAAAAMQGAPALEGDIGEDLSEKTMIFESGFSDLSDAPTQIAVGEGAVRHGRGMESEPSEARTGSVVAPPRQSLHPQPSFGGSESVAHNPMQQKHVGAILIAGAAFLSLLIVLIVLLTGPSGDVGTVVITSTPTNAVDVYLDGVHVGSSTPVTLNDVSVGKHHLLGRAAGYADQAYKFELAPGNPAVVNIELKPLGPPKAASDAVVVVVTNPPGAAVRIGGLAQGVTPLTLTGQNPAQPIILELSKQGYETSTETVQFAPGQKKKRVTVELEPAAGGGPQPTVGTPTAGRGVIEVRSRPSGATVSLGRFTKGETPLVLSELDTSKAYDLELAKEGYRRVKQTVTFRDKARVLVTLQMEPLTKHQRSDSGKKESSGKKKPRASACSGTSGELSVMPIGEGDCKVHVGKSVLGVAPFFRKDAPVGRCEIKVTCPSGKKYRTVKTLRAGVQEKVIIKPDDW